MLLFHSDPKACWPHCLPSLGQPASALSLSAEPKGEEQYFAYSFSDDYLILTYRWTGNGNYQSTFPCERTTNAWFCSAFRNKHQKSGCNIEEGKEQKKGADKRQHEDAFPSTVTFTRGPESVSSKPRYVWKGTGRLLVVRLGTIPCWLSTPYVQGLLHVGDMKRLKNGISPRQA